MHRELKEPVASVKPMISALELSQKYSKKAQEVKTFQSAITFSVRKPGRRGFFWGASFKLSFIETKG